MKHTPGPWRVGPSNDVQGRYADSSQIWVPHGAVSHCVVASVNYHLSQSEANARLIAAAPDLLKAAKEVLAGLNARIDAALADGGHAVPVFHGIAELHAAIAKAENTPAPTVAS